MCPSDTVLVRHQSHDAVRGLHIAGMQLLHYFLLLHRAQQTPSAAARARLSQQIEIYRPNKFPDFGIY
jgi:hypothetical protein